MAEEKQPTWPPTQPYDFGQGQQSVTETPAVPSVPEEEPTGVENVRYDVVTNQDAPDNPKNAREVVERGVVNVANPHPQPSTSTDTEHVTPALSPEQQQRVDATAGIDRQIRTVKDFLDATEHRPETEEQRKKRERKEKSKRIIAAVSDGISALSNLFFTTQYAPNMYNHEKGSMSTAVGRHLDALKAEREKKRDQYINYSLKLGDLENQRAATLRELEAQQERQKLAREKAQREAEEHGWNAALQPDKQREQKGKADKAEQEAIVAEYEAVNKPESLRLDNEYKQAGITQRKAAASNSYASAAAHNRSNVSEFTAWDEHGNEHKFRTEEAAEAYAKQHGTWQEEDISEITNTETRRTPKSEPQQRTSTKTKKSGHPARPSQGTMPGVSDDKNMPGTK